MKYKSLHCKFKELQQWYYDGHVAQKVKEMDGFDTFIGTWGNVVLLQENWKSK